MTLSRDAITGLALRYLSADEIVDFPMENDLFCFMIRPVIEIVELKDEEGWLFKGYGICNGYAFDDAVKPRGKWLWMRYTDLSCFPPASMTTMLQPPHVAKGRYQDASRTFEMRIVKITPEAIGVTAGKAAPRKRAPRKSAEESDAAGHDNVVAFRPKHRN